MPSRVRSPPSPSSGRTSMQLDTRTRALVVDHDAAGATSTERRLKYGEALREATAQEMTHDDTVVVLGLGVNDQQRWIYGTTRDLATEFGEARCFDTPLSE